MVKVHIVEVFGRIFVEYPECPYYYQCGGCRHPLLMLVRERYPTCAQLNNGGRCLFDIHEELKETIS